MATLYLAEDPQLGRKVAIKLLREDFDETGSERFAQEARAAATLAHPNIVTIYEVGIHDSHPFIAMEYVQGETLDQLLRQRRPLTLRRKLTIVRDLCRALQAAHQRGIVHRDVKPANVMIGTDDQVKLLDFGIARTRNSSMTRAGVIIGTPQYMSPEQVEGREVDPRSDLFSVGAVLYEALTLRKPFDGPDITSTILRVLHGAPEPLAALLPGISPEIVALVDRALAKDKAQRYASAAEMEYALDAVLARVELDAAAGLPEAVMPLASAAAPMPRPIPDTIVRPLEPVREGHDSAVAAERANQTIAFMGEAAQVGHTPDAMPAVQLLVLRSGDAPMSGRVVPITEPMLTIGRSIECRLRIDDRQVSRRHAVIEYGPSGFTLRDTSSNGTFLMGRRVASTGERLPFGATIDIGDTSLKFTLASQIRLPDLVDCVLGRRYRLTSLVRDGAKGALYAARDAHIDRDLAVKVMAPDLMRFEAYREQFEREASIGASMVHPHICRVLDRGEGDVSPPTGPPMHVSYLCLEMMSGGDLQEQIRDGPAPLDRVAVWVGHLADALDYGHRHGVIHGDVKPTAIVFSHDGHVYLTDFAFAQRSLSGGGAPALATPAFAAPEIWDHHSPTDRADQYSLAVVAYLLISGSLPYAGQDNPAIRRQNVERGVTPVHTLAKSYREETVPRRASDVLRQALAWEPEHRFETTSAFAQALSAALQGRATARTSPNIFLSYQRDSSAGWANYFAKELKDHDIATFLDVQRLDRAQQFPPRLTRAIEDCDVFVCLLGGTTLQSAWVVEEIRQAHRCGKPMVPIFQETFNPAAVGADDPAVTALLTYDAVHLFDVRNVHIEHSATDLARLVKNTVNRQRDD